MNDKVSMKKSLIINNEKVIRKTPFAKAHYTPLVPSARWRKQGGLREMIDGKPEDVQRGWLVSINRAA